MASTKNPTRRSARRKRQAHPEQQAQPNSRRKISDVQVEMSGFPSQMSSVLHDLHQLPTHTQQQERLVTHFDRQDIVFDPFTPMQIHSFGGNNCDGDVCTDEDTAGSGSCGAPLHQHMSSGADNAPHIMFGEDYVFNDLGTFFNSTEDSIQSSERATQPTSNGSEGHIAPVGLSEDLAEKQPQRISCPPQKAKLEQTESKSKAEKTQEQSKGKRAAGTTSFNLQDTDLDNSKHDNTTNQPMDPEEDDRAMKNIREKKRRKGVSEKFKELYNLVCSNNHKKGSGVDKSSSVKTGRISKARMLEEAIRLIKNMEGECSSLGNRNRYLEYQVHQFQQMPQDTAALAKAASLVAPTMLPFGNPHTVNPFLFMNMASLVPAPLKSH